MAVDEFFSTRHNLRRAVPVSVRDEAPAAFRSFLFETIKHFQSDRGVALDLVYTALGKVPPDLSRDRHASYWSWVNEAINSAQWYKVYDLVEQFFKKSQHLKWMNLDDYRDLVNTFFEENGYSYRLAINGKLEYRGDESFEIAVNTANLALKDAGLLTAQAEIHKALDDLAMRPIADLTGAVQHAMAGLECAAKQISNEPKLELGRVLKKNPDMFPPPLGDVISQLYGYASNNGRHLTEGGEPDFAEAELLVGIATTAATYLARKA